MDVLVDGEPPGTQVSPMKWLLVLSLCVVGCSNETAPPTVGGNGNRTPPGQGIGGGSGGTGGADGGTDAGADGGEPRGACDNGSDLDALEGTGDRPRDIARDCGLIECANWVGNGPGYESCVSTCVADAVAGLSPECIACYGGLERCSLDSFCRSQCQNNTCSTTCLGCMNGAGCLLDLEECRGLPGDGCPDPPP